jgi:hypothetical protein
MLHFSESMLDSAIVVQTAATFGRLYVSIPNDTGSTDGQIDAVE